MLFAEIENRNGGALARTTAHTGAAAATASCCETQGVEKDRFPRTGSAGENVQPRCEVQRNVFDENEVADFQRRQHAEADLEGARKGPADPGSLIDFRLHVMRHEQVVGILVPG